MDPITQQQALAAAGAGSDPVYVDDVYSTYVYEGNDVNGRAINNGIDLSGEGGLVWVKARDVSYNNILQDTERGATSSLKSNSDTAAETISSRVSSFTSTGFTVGTNANVNASNQPYVSWTFRKAPGFFDVVKFTGTGSAQAIAHNLGCVPGFIIVKNLDTAGRPWRCYHSGIGNNHYLRLNETDPKAQHENTWNQTNPTSTHFTVGSEADVNGTNDEHIAYLFADGSDADSAVFGEDGDEKIIKCGTYTGTSGTEEINVGFEPQWILIKRVNAGSDNWVVYDVMREWQAYADSHALHPNSNAVEYTGAGLIHPTATGFKAISNDGIFGGSGDTYVYVAIRRPHKPPTTGTDVFQMDVNTTSEPEYVSNFVVDWAFHRNITGTDNFDTYARLTGASRLELNTSGTEAANSAARFDFNNGWGDNLANSTSYRSWMFRRVPGFMDVVTYIGTGTTANIPHSLGVAPEMIWVKCRDNTENWSVYYVGAGSNRYMHLNQNQQSYVDSAFWANTSPTASQFTVGWKNMTNLNTNKFIAILFASLPGISKIGSYTGTGNAGNNVDCGFTNGARFVMVKKTTGSGNWWFADTLRGINTGNDPFLALNSTSNENNTVDWIDAYSAGFTINGAGGDYNNSGSSYLFFAIA